MLIKFSFILCPDLWIKVIRLLLHKIVTNSTYLVFSRKSHASLKHFILFQISALLLIVIDLEKYKHVAS